MDACFEKNNLKEWDKKLKEIKAPRFPAVTVVVKTLTDI